MPLVNGKRFAYTSAGRAAAKREAARTGKAIQIGKTAAPVKGMRQDAGSAAPPIPVMGGTARPVLRRMKRGGGVITKITGGAIRG